MTHDPRPLVATVDGVTAIGCSCGWAVTGKTSRRAAGRSFSQHRANVHAVEKWNSR